MPISHSSYHSNKIPFHEQASEQAASSQIKIDYYINVCNRVIALLELTFASLLHPPTTRRIYIYIIFHSIEHLKSFLSFHQILPPIYSRGIYMYTLGKHCCCHRVCLSPTFSHYIGNFISANIWYYSAGTSAWITLQDIVRNDPGYTPNIEHLVFPEQKKTNTNILSKGTSQLNQFKGKSSGVGGVTSSARTRLIEVFKKILFCIYIWIFIIIPL